MKLLFLLISVVTADLDWWKTALVYQIYPRSFKDSNGDGIGDLAGITEKLNFIKDTGVDAIWICPIFLSPMRDAGYDITDYREIAPEFGTMKDFEELLVKAKSLEIRVLLDFVPNHTSNESEWFLRSIQRDPEYDDYYVWADGIENEDGSISHPSNWPSNFRKSSWEYYEGRGQYYLHQFAIRQPDLNYRNEKVQQEMKEVLRFWLDKGVSGFRMDAVNMLYEADPKNFGGRYPDEPRSEIANALPDDYFFLKHIYTRDLDENYDVVYDWRDVLDEYTKKQQEYKLMITEAYADIKYLMKYYGNDKRNGSIPFNFGLLELKNNSNAFEIKAAVDEWMVNMPKGKIATWVNGNHDKSRLASRVGLKRVDAMNMLALMLPGIAFTYQGEELGMTDGFVSWEDTQDPQAINTDDPINYWKNSRDPCRTPYHWDDSENAGFSTTNNKTWLPVANNFKEINLKAQMDSESSHYKFYRDVALARKLPAMHEGGLDVRTLSDTILIVNRILEEEPAIVGLVNLSHEEQTINLLDFDSLSTHLLVIASGVDCDGIRSGKGSIVSKHKIVISGNCAILLRSLDSDLNFM